MSAAVVSTAGVTDGGGCDGGSEASPSPLGSLATIATKCRLNQQPTRRSACGATPLHGIMLPMLHVWLRSSTASRVTEDLNLSATAATKAMSVHVSGRRTRSHQPATDGVAPLRASAGQ